MKKHIAIAIALLACLSLSAQTVQPKLHVGPNEPIGEGKGINPGRVAWIHSPGVANWNGVDGLWVEDRWNDQQKADAMIKDAVVKLTGEKNASKAWDALFRSFNKTHGRGKHGYRPGEKIAIKLNINNALTHRDTIELNSSPFVTLALLRSLVYDGKVRQEDITLCEPSRPITDSIYFKCVREFPKVTFVDNLGGEGRVKADYYDNQIPYSVDNGKLATGLAKCVVDADYLINSSLLKTHVGPGVTLTSKNWYGATDINLLWQKNQHNGFNQDKRNGKPGYRTFVDFIAHKDLGGKCMLFLIDATYGSRHVNGKPYPQWMNPPFNGGWCCSILASQDELALDSVGLDMLVGEWPSFGSLNYCDEYLWEAASIPNTPSGTVYDPERDGSIVTKPLGLMEHWNNATDRKYTKIDLVYSLHGETLKPIDPDDMARHDFVYVGEWDTRKPDCQSIFIIRDGKLSWSYSIPMRDKYGRIQEFDDVHMLPNGNIMFAAMSRLGIVTPDKKLVWDFECPQGTESHSCQPIGDDKALIVLNGHPCKLLIYDTKNDKCLREIVVPTNGDNTHGQVRHARMTPQGTVTMGLLPEKKAIEMDLDGNILWQVDAPSAWSVIKLNSGNYLISGDSRGYTREVDAKGATVWELTQEDVPFKLYNTQTATRLANGNTVICNWVAGRPEDEWKGSVQVFEVTIEKQVVWKVSSWDDPDLGPATFVHILDEPGDILKFEQQR